LHLLFFGCGFAGKALARRVLGEGWRVSAALRRAEARLEAEQAGMQTIVSTDLDALAKAVRAADAILVAAPPSADGCPGFAALSPIFQGGAAPAKWIGYLSTTGVYGDQGGRWVFETSPVKAQSVEGARRVAAEHDWLGLGQPSGPNVAVFRLPGIYGPGRSALDRVRDGTAHRWVKPGQVFSRIHVDDLAAGLQASMVRPRAGAIYHLCDDEPAPADQVTAFAAELLGMEPPSAQPYDEQAVSPALRRFYGENKRISNALAKAELGWRPAYCSYREGLRAVLAGQASRR
jgi:nucleoside-diphosphate-sugar epimerase